MPEWFRAIQESFGSDNSVPMLLTTVAVLLTLPIIAAVSYNFLQKWGSGGDINRPLSLFRRVLRHLPLSKAQRALAWRMGRELKLPNPTVILLSAELFEQHAAQWIRDMDPRRREALELNVLSGLPKALFGSV